MSELEVLQAMFEGELVRCDDGSHKLLLTRGNHRLHLHISLPEGYPDCSPSVEVLPTSSVTPSDAAALNELAKRTCAENAGSPALLPVITALQDATRDLPPPRTVTPPPPPVPTKRPTPPPPAAKKPHQPSPTRRPSPTPTPGAGAGAGDKEAEREYLVPADRVFHRILWDGRIPPAEFEVGYMDCFEGLQFLPVLAFRGTGDETTEIPFHRVRQFRLKGHTIVWDRAARLDALDAAFAAAAAAGPGGPPTHPPLRALARAAAPLEVRTPHAFATADRARAARGGGGGGRVVVMTYNVLCDAFPGGEKLRLEERLPLVVAEIQRAAPDVVLLQEVTPRIWKYLVEDAYVGRRYVVTQLAEGARMGQAVLSALPVEEAVVVPLSAGKHVVAVGVRVGGDEPVVFANVHLASNLSDEKGTKRTAQCAGVLKMLAAWGNVVVGGDFNFGDEDPEATAVPWAPFRDVWRACRGERAAGWTFDPKRNTMAKLTTRRGEPRRYDRVIFKGRVAPVAAELCGVVARPAPGGPALHPSDHFAVRCVLAVGAAALGIVPDTVPPEDVPADAPATSSSSESESSSSDADDDDTDGELLPRGASGGASAVVAGGGDDDDTSSAARCTAVCLLLPDAAAAAMDAVRATRDRAYAKWPAHVNIVFPFVRGGDLAVAARVLAPIAAAMGPVELTFSRLAAFATPRGAVVHAVAEAPAGALEALRAACARVFPGCGERGLDFRPHCTLAQCRTAESAALLATLRAAWRPVTCRVDALSITGCRAGRARVSELFSLPFGGAAQPLDISTLARAAAAAAAAGKLVLESGRPGRAEPQPYLPDDPLERWLLARTDAERARVAPTHASMRGGVYAVRLDDVRTLDEYLAAWGAAMDGGDTAPFFVEEVRGNVYRLYVDVDIKRTVAAPVEREHAAALVAAVCAAAARAFPQCDASAVVVECHGAWSDAVTADAVYKSGLRVYFRRVWVTAAAHAAFVRALPAALDAAGVPLPAALPAGYGWSEVFDVAGVTWPRARLLGTMKLRRMLRRVYSLCGVWTPAGRDEEATRALRAAPREVLLLATSVCAWCIAPSSAAAAAAAVGYADGQVHAQCHAPSAA